ncbi:MAG: GNAT family N-acetyltransferase [Phycisphaerales bacterium]|nr:GNAT family N-acetyltransferase [Phycisphaerales bacterium]
MTQRMQICDVPSTDPRYLSTMGGLLAALGTLIDDPTRLREWLLSQRRLRVNTDLLVAAFDGERLMASAAALGLPGGAALLLLPPRLPARTVPQVAHAIVQRVKARCVDTGIRLVQALTEVEDRTWPAVLRDCGLHFVTRLLHLRRNVSAADPSASRHSDLRWIPYSEAERPRFIAMLARSYEATTDFPELSAARSAEDALESHTAAGESGTQMWGLGLLEEQPVAVLLAALHPGLSMLEVAYLGVAREARGRGIGSQVLARARDEAVRASANVLALSVDRRNESARRLYDRWGFRPSGERDAWIHVVSDDA